MFQICIQLHKNVTSQIIPFINKTLQNILYYLANICEKCDNANMRIQKPHSARTDKFLHITNFV